MPATILVGAQWGDEGKGRVADWLAAQSDVVARYAGGDNAGHTVVVGGAVHKLHLIPSGILHPDVVCVLGNGMVVNPVSLVREMQELRASGVEVTPQRLALSSRAHVITPAHLALDRASEAARGTGALGTTLRGIGPAYLDKAGRQGVRAGEMADPEAFGDALRRGVERANASLRAQGLEPLDPAAVVLPYVDAARRLRPYLRDTSVYLNRRLNDGARVLCEGAQGTLLDVDHGDYPYVTSSSPTAGGALSGLGIGPTRVDRVVGVAKCFSTRVGAGPFPTELDGDMASRLRGTGANFWDEFGTTTGRPRRTGWLDAVLLRYSARVNGFTELVITKLDVLSGLESLHIAVAYRLGSQTLDDPPDRLADLERVEPVYEALPGWSDDLTGARAWDDLPAATRAYVTRIEALVGVRVSTLSVGPERAQLVFAP